MNVSVTARHMDMTPSIKEYVEEGLEKLVDHFDNVTNVDVILSVEKHRNIAEINLHANGLRINAKESLNDMYAAVDAALSKIERQVRKHLDRISKHQPRRAKNPQNMDHQIIQFAPHEDDDSGDSSETFRTRIVSHEVLTMSPMTVEEAALQLDLIEDSFFVFSNADTQQVNVIYGRDDGTYGHIEPQF